MPQSVADRLIYAAFLLFGVTSLLPYNMFMNAHTYFDFKLRNTTADSNSSLVDDVVRDEGHHEATLLQTQFEAYVVLACGVSCIIGSMLNLLFAAKISNTARVLAGHFIVVASLLPTVWYTYVDTDDDQEWFFWVSQGLAAVSTLGSMGLIGGGVFGLAATFPAFTMRSLMLGQSLAGVLSVALSLLCQMGTSDAVANGRVFFCLAIGWTIASIVLFTVVARSQYAKDVKLINSAGYSALNEDDEEGDDRMRQIEDSAYPVASRENPFDETEGQQRTGLSAWAEVFRQAASPLVSASLVLIITLTVFPGVAALVKTTSRNETWKAYFTAVCCFVVFNCGDALGRLLASTVEMSPGGLLRACLSRAALIPLLMLCHVPSRKILPTLLPWDGAFALVMLVLAVSNGFCITVSATKATRGVEASLRESAGSLFNLTAQLAALVGSALGVGMIMLL